MSVDEILEKMKDIHSNILEFFDNEGDLDENFQDLLSIFMDKKIQDSKYDLLSIFHLVTDIANNHHRGPNFFIKIEKILNFFENSIKKNFSNSEIFNIFKSNKRILLFLVESKLLFFDEYLTKKIMTQKYQDAKYPQYFAPEIKPFSNLNSASDLPNNFYNNRKEAENENIICKFIRQDSVEEFITYVTQTNYSLKSIIKSSIYETNYFLVKKQSYFDYINHKMLLEYNRRKSYYTDEMSYSDDEISYSGISLIEYASFFGSIQIFRYLIQNGITLTPSLWIYSIHGNNPEIIHILEENGIQMDCSHNDNFYESIKCNHNDIAQYIINEYLQIGVENSFNSCHQIIKYHNYSLLKNEMICQKYFQLLCQYDYPSFVQILLKTMDSDSLNDYILKSFYFN